MPADLLQPTAYQPINLLLHKLSTEGQAVLGDAFFGLYLYGSLASGDFNLYRSDIDFLCITRGNLKDEQVAGLEEMHAYLSASGMPWVEKLEGVYMPLALLPRYQAYAIVSMCRALYSLHFGALLSKPASAIWAVNALDPEWKPLIEEAIQWRPGQSLDKMKQTLRFIHFVIRRSQAD
jgi:hypothetical protein